VHLENVEEQTEKTGCEVYDEDEGIGSTKDEAERQSE
jgi:hypothetical protein